jgi:predicted enzyme related to lactoylglutathione lyase
LREGLALATGICQDLWMARVLINLDVPDLAAAERFYCEALELRIGQRLSPDITELLGAEAPLYLLHKPHDEKRDYRRHWTPVHLDFAVVDLDSALARALAAGAALEGEVRSYDWGRLALCADPFGHGFCLLQFVGNGYEVGS